MKRSRAERDPTNGGDHSKRHGRCYRKPRSEKPARERVAHDECREWARNHARHKGERPAVALMRVVIASCRVPEQESTDQGHHRAARELELGRAPTLSESAADNGEAGEDQNKSESDMG